MQPLYEEFQLRFRSIEFVHCMPDHLNEPRYLDVVRMNWLVFDDLMIEAKCDQRIADLFTRGSQRLAKKVVNNRLTVMLLQSMMVMNYL